MSMTKSEAPKAKIMSVYRISLYLFTEWKDQVNPKSVFEEENKMNPELDSFSSWATKSILSKFQTNYFEPWYVKMRSWFFQNYISSIKTKLGDELIGPYYKEFDFFDTDIETIKKTFPVLSELESNRIEIVKNYLSKLRPLLQKGLIKSLVNESGVKLKKSEVKLIYILLGYFSTETGRNFLSNLESPKLIRRARKVGNFAKLKRIIDVEEIQELVASITGVPVQSLSVQETDKLLKLEEKLHDRVVGQEEAVSAIAKAIRRSRLGIRNTKRPIASFLFCGPTGVGKTEVTKALASTMFGGEKDMIRFDMSEFMEKFTISRLVGSPPGYVGYDEGGQLTDAVRRKPYSVVLFDEIEKAHPDVLNILLQILDDGRLTDSKKRLVLFDNTLIILTSNAGSDEIQQIIRSQDAISYNPKTKNGQTKTGEDSSSVAKEPTEKDLIFNDEYAGPIQFLRSPITENFLTDIRKQLQGEFEKSFRNVSTYALMERELKRQAKKGEETGIFDFDLEVEKELDKKSEKKKEKTIDSEPEEGDSLNRDLKNAVMNRLVTLFLPEFLNRLDDIIVFKPLTPEDLTKICDFMLNDVIERVKEKDIFLTVDERVKKKLSQEGYNPLYGARPLRRLITKYIEDLVSENMLLTASSLSLVADKSRYFSITLGPGEKIVLNQTKKSTLIAYS